MSWISAAWHWCSNNAATFIGATGAFTTAVVLAWTEIRNARTARQAEISGQRHEEQIRADRQRRIAESFSKAVEQLASDKIAVRLGGIDALERISRESEEDYLTVMETLAGFVRECAPWRESNESGSETVVRFYVPVDSVEEAQPLSPPADVAAALAVIVHRPEVGRARETAERWHFELRNTDLRGANLNEASLPGVDLSAANLEGALLRGAHLQDAVLTSANLQGAVLSYAHCQRANLNGARLQGAALIEVHLEGAHLIFAHLEDAHPADARFEGASLQGTFLEGADLRLAAGLTSEQLADAQASATTLLPAGISRPSHWPPASEAESQ